MARVRVFGAVSGAGTQVREVSPDKPIQDGPLGSTIIAGMFRSGPIDEVVECDGLDHYHRVFGGLTQESEAPLACEDFFEMARGAGKLYVVRVADEDETAADIVLWNRNVGLSILEVSQQDIADQDFTLAAHNAGRWAGRRAWKSGDVDLSTDITGVGTIDLGFTSSVKDQWKGATLAFPNDDASATFKVTGNTAAGVFTIEGDFTADVIAGTDGQFTLELANTHELTGKGEHLAVCVKDSGVNNAKFSLQAFRDGGHVKSWEDLGLDSSGDAYWLDAINDDTRQWELAATDAFSGDNSEALNRPANYAEIPAPDGVSSDGNQITFQTLRWRASLTGSADCYLDTVNDWTHPSEPIPLTIVLTFTSGTAFTVTMTTETGETLDDLPAGALDAAYASQNKWAPAFTLSDGGNAPTAGDTVTIYYRPLPSNLSKKGCLFYPAAAPSEGDVRISYRVRSNDEETITLAAGVDASSEVTAPGAPTNTGDTAGPFDFSSGTLTFIYDVGGRAAATLTSTLSGAAETTTAVAADLNARELARVSAVAADKVVEFGVSSDDKLTVTALQDFGPAAVLTIGSGGLNAKLGFTNDETTAGATPTIGRLEFRQELEGGIDGFAGISDDDYVQALGYGDSDPLGELLEKNTGLLQLAVPGVTAADVQAAAMLWAYQTNGLFYAEIPSGKTTEADAMDWHANNLAVGEDAGQGYHRALFPTYGKRKSPYGSGLYTAPITGAVLGLNARKANEAGGYHLAPAGTGYRIDSIFVDLTTGKTKLNNEVLNAYGLTEVRRRGPAITIWGDRIAGDGERPFFHKRASIQHIGRVLLNNTLHLVFLPINAITFFRAKKDVRELFFPWYVTGWFDDIAGQAFEDQVAIKVDETNNPSSERTLGNLNIAIGFGIVNTAERVVFTIGPKGLSIEG